MPRSSSPSRTGPTRRIVSVTKRTAAPVSAPMHTTAPNIIAERPSFGQSVKEGFGWGVGTSIARSLFGGSQSQAVPVTPVAPAAPTPKNPEYEQCMKESFNNAEACKQYLNTP